MKVCHLESHEVTSEASKATCEDEDKKNSSKCTGCSIMCILLVIFFCVHIRLKFCVCRTS